VNQWVASIDLDPHKYGTHSLRRTRAAQIYKATGNLRAVQLLLGHTKLESRIRYLGVESKTPWRSRNAWNSELRRVAAPFWCRHPLHRSTPVHWLPFH
jgi:integrase